MNGSERSMIRAIRGPITLITLGVLFALNNFTRFHFEQTWPVLLIVFGLLSLLRRGVEAAPLQPPGAPPYAYPPPPYAPYPPAAAPPMGTAKGGFGSSAPPRAGEPGQTPPGGSL
ncbi:MAG: DUF5668 domain-containing protein [Acidobacteriia bacterium]|nr:DUF5668 domain-containing protein [Terriglobia bacterium]